MGSFATTATQALETSQIITLTIEDSCLSTVLTSTSLNQAPPYIYYLGDPALTLSFKPWTESLGSCGPFTYYLNE